jgi:hypothetical protein
MRTNLTFGVGLVAVVLAIVGPPLVALSSRPYKPLRVAISAEVLFPVEWLGCSPPLRIGMTKHEVMEALQPTFYSPCNNLMDRRVTYCLLEADWLGYERSVHVCYDEEGLVKQWEVLIDVRTRPHWLDVLLKCIGW